MRDLTKGVPAAEGWRLIEATDSGLIDTWRAAQAAFDRSERGWHERNNDYQRSTGIPRRCVESPYAKGLAVAEAAVAEALEALISSGAVAYGGFPQGQLHGAPVVIPLAALGRRRPRSPRVTVEGVVFYRVRLYRAEALAAAEPETVADPPPTTDRLVAALAELFVEDSAWETLGPAKLAPIVEQRDRRFRPGNGIWAPATLVEKIKVFKQAAKAEARTRRA